MYVELILAQKVDWRTYSTIQKWPLQLIIKKKDVQDFYHLHGKTKEAVVNTSLPIDEVIETKNDNLDVEQTVQKGKGNLEGGEGGGLLKKSPQSV